MRRHVLLPAEPSLGSDIYGLASHAKSLVQIVPVPFEATVSYGGGTAKGPSAVFAASAQVDLFDPDTGRAHRVGIAGVSEPRAIAQLSKKARRAAKPVIAVLGEVGTNRRLQRLQRSVTAAGDQVNAWLENTVERLLDAGHIVGVVGGDHSVPFASIRSHVRRWPELGLLHFDAHADLRDAYEGFTWSHASIMHNVTSRIPELKKLVQVGIRDFCDEELQRIVTSKGRITAFTDQELRDQLLSGTSFIELARRIVKELPREVYVSFDIDGLDPALCPHTGTPVPGGLSFQQAVLVLAEVVRAGKTIVGFDLCEVAPGPKGDEWDANVGARILYKLIGFTVASRTVALSPRFLEAR